MKSLQALAGITLAGAALSTLWFGFFVGICTGIFILGLGLFIDAVRK
jgi:hypothetical protein